MTQVLSICAVLLGMAALMFLARVFATATSTVMQRRGVNVCAPCATFWLTWAALLIAAALFQPVTLRTVIDALIFAFINFFYIKSKIQIYE